MINTPISACVITANDERCIGACIDSLRICDEIIVVDAHSTDRTREIARARGARVVERDWSGVRTQQQFAVSLARNDWILSIGADERMSPVLSSEIVRVRLYGLDEFAGYQIPFLDAHSACPDVRLRLFNRRRARFGGEPDRGRVIAYGPVGQFRGNIQHDSPLERVERSATPRGFLDPAWRFLRARILRLDQPPGPV